MELWQFITLIAVISVFGIITIIVASRKKDDTQKLERLLAEHSAKNTEELERTKRNILEANDERIRHMTELLKSQQDAYAKELSANQTAVNLAITANATRSEERFKTFEQTTLAGTTRSEERLKTFEQTTARELDSIRQTMERQIKTMSDDNGKRIDEMRGIMDKRLDEVKTVVDEKLQKTLNERITESFKMVNERLAEVYRGLGEMKTLADGVGDLKKVLSNVKTRGTLGEIQLGAILEDILTSEQYVKNFDAKQRSNERVEYAVRLPNDGETPVYLPIDSKYPSDAYMKLSDAYDAADPAAVASAQKNLCDTIMRFARDIRDKYIDPPRTTDFAIMFLPTEGIYAEAVRLGMVEKLQREAHINIAGPSTMAALLNSLRMGFSNFAMQKRSTEAWQVLGAVKTEITKFEGVLLSAQKQINKANDDLEQLIGARTKQIMRKLKNVESIPSSESAALIDDGDQ